MEFDCPFVRWRIKMIVSLATLQLNINHRLLESEGEVLVFGLSHLPHHLPSVFLYSCMASVLDRWDVPVGVFPFNITATLYLLCTGPDNPYFPHHRTSPLGVLEPNGTKLAVQEVLRDTQWWLNCSNSAITVQNFVFFLLMFWHIYWLLLHVIFLFFFFWSECHHVLLLQRDSCCLNRDDPYYHAVTKAGACY